MPDPVPSFMQNLAPNLLASQNLQPLQQAGPTAAQNLTAAAQGFIDPYRAAFQRLNPNARLIPSATGQPVGGGMVQPPPAPPAMPGTSPVPGMPPQPPPGMPLPLLPPNMGYPR